MGVIFIATDTAERARHLPCFRLMEGMPVAWPLTPAQGVDAEEAGRQLQMAVKSITYHVAAEDPTVDLARGRESEIKPEHRIRRVSVMMEETFGSIARRKI